MSLWHDIVTVVRRDRGRQGRPRRCATCALAVAAAITVGTVSLGAQDRLHQTVVVTAAAHPVELGTATRTLTVITREQIEALPAQTVADVLRLASSVDVRARGVRGVQTDFAVRGATFGQMLVLVDGVRLNDAQSGHHNGDIPVPLDAVERIEVLYGPASAVLGADAFGGTVNVITRAASGPAVHVQGGSFGLASGRAQASVTSGAAAHLFSVAADRSSGFMEERDFQTTTLRSRTTFGDRANVSVSFARKEFGANGFYGPSPSREWTNQTLLAADRRFAARGGWNLSALGSYRTHGDRFVWTVHNPALSDNRHRTHAVLGRFGASRRVSGQGVLTVGVEAGGDWIRSSNLGDHAVSRASGFGEWRQDIGGRAQVDAAVRVDRYDEFGTAWNPSLGVGWWVGNRVRLRASVARAFRVPTFTERYYSDPAHLARADVGPETAWAGEGGVDWLAGDGLLVQATVFGRADEDVIDWLRASAAERWHTENVREVSTLGVELAVRKSVGAGAFVQASYTGVDLDAASVTMLSKYVLDYAPHSLTAAALVPLPSAFRVSPRLEYRHRSRSSGESDDVLLDLRISRPIGRGLELQVEGTNLLDQRYQEVAGVAMPGAAFSVALGASW